MELSLRTDRGSAPPIVDAVDFHLELKPYEKFSLDNGVPVYAVNAGAEEVMMVEWVFFAGNSFEEKNLVAATANYLLKNGTSGKNAFRINEHFEYFGAHLNRACYNETATLTLHCLNKYIGDLLPVVGELITDSRMPEEELALYKQNMKQRLTVNLRKADFVAGRLIEAYLYGKDHPYGKYSSHEEFDALNREELLQYFDEYYRNGRLIIFTAGKLPNDTFELLNRYFGKLPMKNREVPLMPPQPATEKKYRINNDPDSLQGSIRIARNFPNRHHPDFKKVMVLNNVFGGYFGSRLMRNIREEKGYTYGIHSYVQNHMQHSAWMISTEAGKSVCEAAIEEVYKEMKVLQETPVGDDEMMLVRNYIMGTILGDLDGPFQIIARWKNYVLNGLDENYFYESIDTIKNISAEELQMLAKKYLNPEDFFELVVV